MEKILNKRNTIIFVGLLTLWRMYLSAVLQLHPDEAYYWMWSRHLDLGYFDHSPLVAYFIRLTTLFSQSELWVRFPGIIVSVAISILCWILSQQMFKSEKISAGSVILLNTFPLTMTGTILITPDIPAFLFWALAVFFFWQIVRTGNTVYWYVTGVMFGLSLLSKYTGVLLAPSLFLFLLMTDERRWLKTIHPYASFLIGLIFFMPVVYWNSRHDWISFAFQFGHGLGGQTYSAGRLIEYIGGQLLVASPFLWLIGMAATSVYLFSKSKEKLFLSLTSLPIILFFGFSSLKRLAGPNWPACAYLTFSIAATELLFTNAKRWKEALWAFAITVSFLISFLAMLHARFSVVPLAKYSRDLAIADATNWFYGWRELAQELEKYPETKFALTSSHQISAEISYYSREKVYAYINKKLTRPSQFNLWTFPDSLKDVGGCYVYVEGEAQGDIKNLFSSSGSPGSRSILRNGFPIRTYVIIPCKGYLQEE